MKSTSLNATNSSNPGWVLKQHECSPFSSIQTGKAKPSCSRGIYKEGQRSTPYCSFVWLLAAGCAYGVQPWQPPAQAEPERWADLPSPLPRWAIRRGAPGVVQVSRRCPGRRRHWRHAICVDHEGPRSQAVPQCPLCGGKGWFCLHGGLSEKGPLIERDTDSSANTDKYPIIIVLWFGNIQSYFKCSTKCTKLHLFPLKDEMFLMMKDFCQWKICV